MSKKRKPFQIPQQILEQLNEFSNGGYLLIKMGENGQPPDVFMQADNTIIALGLIRYTQMWSAALDQLSEASLFESLGGPNNEEDNENEDEE